jgi:BMFP domain-containing protein YqiC
VTCESLETELATARHRNQELERKVRVLERRLRSNESPLGPALMDHHGSSILNGQL